jgi:hypothetical protein
MSFDIPFLFLAGVQCDYCRLLAAVSLIRLKWFTLSF